MERLTFKEKRHSRNDQKSRLCFRGMKRLCSVAGGDGQGKGGGEVLTSPSQQRKWGGEWRDRDEGWIARRPAVEEKSVSEARGRKVRAKSEGVRARGRVGCEGVRVKVRARL